MTKVIHSEGIEEIQYEVVPTPTFKKEAKRLAKKYKSLKAELKQLDESLKSNPETIGTPLGNNTYKVRMAIKSKNKGKSGGARIITYVVHPDNEVYLLSIYDKSEMDTISDERLQELIDPIGK
jgi:mRNA-degrading endonuclease RelE of RelBE toxin-antitoxin system